MPEQIYAKLGEEWLAVSRPGIVLGESAVRGQAAVRRTKPNGHPANRLHSITQSTRRRIDGGILSPNA